MKLHERAYHLSELSSLHKITRWEKWFHLSVVFFWNKKAPLRLHRIIFFGDRNLLLAKHCHIFRFGLEYPHTSFFPHSWLSEVAHENQKRGSSERNKQEASWAQKGKANMSLLNLATFENYQRVFNSKQKTPRDIIIKMTKAKIKDRKLELE